MEPLEREDSSTYVSQPQQQPHAAPQPIQKVEPPKPKKSRVAGVLAFLLLLAIVCAAALGWLWYQQNGRVGDLESDLSSARNNVARLESAAKAQAKLDDSEVTTDTDSTSSDAIIKTALAYAQAPSESKSVKYETKIVYNKDNFARVTVGSGPAVGFTELLKYVNDQWVVIVSGQNEPSSDDVKTYGIPQAAIDSYKM